MLMVYANSGYIRQDNGFHLLTVNEELKDGGHQGTVDTSSSPQKKWPNTDIPILIFAL